MSQIFAKIKSINKTQQKETPSVASVTTPSVASITTPSVASVTITFEV